MKKLLEKINNKERKKIVIEIVSVLVLMTLFIGVSIAGGYWTYKSSTANTLETGSVSMTFLESNSVIDITNALPKSDNAGKTQTDLFEFAVTTNSGAIQTISYDISIEPIVVESGYTGLNPEDIKVYLTDKEGNVLVQPTKLSDLTDFKLYSKKHKHIAEDTRLTSKYVLRAWIDGGVRATDWYKEYTDSNIQYQYKFRVNVNGKSIAEKYPAVKKLLKNVGNGGLEEVTHTADSTLQIGAIEDITEYRFRGGNDVVTNNYVYFNCSDINNQTADTCELYRIIGIFPVDDGTGNIENRIKLIKAENYGNNYWDINRTNNWAEPASPNTEFNTTYWGTINEKYQALVGDAKYYLGGYDKNPKISTSVMYGYERKIDESDGGNYYYDTNPTNWTGKIALMYASDYGYGAISACSESTNLFNYSTCYDNNWLYLGDYEWLLPQLSGNPNTAFYVHLDGFVHGNNVENYRYALRPVLYLTSDAEFNDKGDGTQNNPYQLRE